MADIIFAGVAGGEWGKAGGTNKRIVTDTQNNKDGFSSFEWGKPAYPKDFPEPNSLVFTKDQTFDAGLNEAFSVGELGYFNGSVEVKTVADFVPLKVELDFNTPEGKKQVFEYDLNLNTTNDDGVLDIDAWSDFVFFPESFSPKEFKYDGKDYTLELMGFSKDGGKTIESQFRVREQELDSAELFAKITEAPRKKPPGDTDSTPDDAEKLKRRDDADGEIGFTEGGVRDNVDYYEFTVKDYSQVAITLDQLERNANLDILDADGRTVLWQSRELGGRRERIVEEFNPGTYFARVYPETYDDGTPYNLKITTSTIKDEKDSLASADDLGVLGWDTSLEDQVGAGKGRRRDQADWYKFTLDEQKDLILTLDGMRGGNANVELLSSSGDIIDTGDKPGTKAERIVQRELAKGDYYVKITPGASKDKPRYNLQLSALEVDADDDGSAPGIDLGVLLPDRKPIKSPRRTRIGGREKGRRDTSDFYKFSLAADSDVTVNIGGMRKAGVEATLFRWEGGELTDEVGEFTKKGKKGIVIEESNLEAGEYVLALEAGAGVNTPYNFNIIAQPEYVDDFYPRFENALEIGDITGYAPSEDKFEHKNRVGQNFGKGDRDQADWFTFELTEEKDVSVKLLNNRGGADVRLYTGRESGPTRTGEKDGKNESIDVETLEKGKYYVEVLPGRGGRGNGSYRLELGLVDGGPANPEIIEIGELSKFQQRERIGEVISRTKNTEDWYKFSVDGDKEIEIVVNGLSDNADLRLEKVVRGGTTQIGFELEEEENSEKLTASLDKGNYIAKVISRGTAESRYQFGARVVGGGGEDPNGEPPTRVTEIDDPSEYGTSDSVGSRESYGRDQNDYYEFTLDATQDISLTVDADRPLTLQLLEENESVIDSFASVKDKTYTTELDAGTYYINVQAGSRTANYELNLSAGDAEGDPDRGPDGTEWVNEVGNLTEYTSGKDSIGFVESYGPDTADWYEFSVTENSEFNLNVSGLRQDVNVRLRDRNGTVLKNEKGKGDILLDYDLNRTGTYYVEIASRGKGTAYDLNMSASSGSGPDDNDTFPKADPLTNAVSSDVGGKGDPRDWYKFTASGGPTTIAIDTAGGGAQAALYDSKGILVDTTAGAGSLNPFLQAGQDYFLEVTPTGSSTSFYDLTVV